MSWIRLSRGGGGGGGGGGAAGVTYVDECHGPDDVDGSDMCLFGDEFSGRSDNYILLRMSCIARMV